MKLWALLFLVAFSSCAKLSAAIEDNGERKADVSGQLLARPEGPISDAADLLASSDERKLDRRLREVFYQKKTAFIVVTVRSLAGQDVATFTNTLARRWKVGGARGGVILLVAPTERQMRIETDNKVRVRLSDEQCLEIVRNVLAPRFRTSDFAAGIAAGVEAIAARL